MKNRLNFKSMLFVVLVTVLTACNHTANNNKYEASSSEPALEQVSEAPSTAVVPSDATDEAEANNDVRVADEVASQAKLEEELPFMKSIDSVGSQASTVETPTEEQAPPQEVSKASPLPQSEAPATIRTQRRTQSEEKVVKEPQQRVADDDEPKKEESEEDEPSSTQNVYILKEAKLEMSVADHDKASTEIEALVDRYKGYVSSEEKNNSDYRIESQYVIRVPAKYLDVFLNNLERLAENVNAKTVIATDVGEEYVDIETRLKTKLEAEERYRGFLKKAKNIDEVVKLEDAIREIREEVESKQGRLNYLRNRMRYSTINLTMYQTVDSKFVPVDNERGFFNRMGEAIYNGWNLVQSLLLGVLTVWPLVLLGVLGLWFWRSRKQKRSVGGQTNNTDSKEN